MAKRLVQTGMDQLADIALEAGIDLARPAGPQVESVLREMILGLDLEPGARLSENELARFFNVSRTPVREAISALAGEQLVEVRPQRGTYVARISPQAVRESQFIREALEIAAVRSAAEDMTEDELEACFEAMELQKKAAEDDNSKAFHEADILFHHRIASVAGFPRVSELAARERAHTDRLRLLSMSTRPPYQRLIDQHGDILLALHDRDADAATRAMENHLREILRAIPDAVFAHPAYFTAP